MAVIIVRQEKQTPAKARASLLLQIRAVGLPEPVCTATTGHEWLVVPNPLPSGLSVAARAMMTRTDKHGKTVRKLWRFDLAWPEVKLAVELDGGIWSNGGHNRGKHMQSDNDKINSANLLGWRVYRITYDQIADGRAVALIEAAYAILSSPQI